MLNHLAGVRVLEIGRMLPSGIAGYELAKLGADVIKVEFPPHGDYLRNNPPFIDDRGDMFLDPNRNKRSLGVDGASEEGRKLYLELAAKADVIIAAAKPGTYERLGIGYETIKADNPGIIFCEMSGFGQNGPYRDLAAHGYSADLAAGVVGLEERDGIQTFPDSHIPISPRVAGLNAAIAILGSLFRKQATGEGEYLDVAQFDSAVVFGYRDLIQYANNGRRGPTFADYGPRFQVHAAKDGKQVLFAIPEARLWKRFCRALDRPDLEAFATDAVLEYTESAELQAEMKKVAATKTLSEWVAFAVETGVAIAPHVPVEDLPTNEHLIARKMLVPVASPNSGKEILLSGSAVKYRSAEVDFTPAPELGGESVEVLREFGIDDDRISALTESGVVVQGGAQAPVSTGS
ncbi:CaiB/BaiF CoA-transferase family protein [Mycobacterium sp. GA-2829]|uniref:CaiB/BaiF CoA transferase family protein n=1 Tax=Mycobacterium sp. GA-2829 TaxID=1772283 RepID=UPI0007404569|nr:CaiB/BaiF CoA-transferase family protein [Mycobacterium sp. GA-2829]KUI36473.1 hypothetical protein AU194_08285 [Mycobacterium sp. GA-2829]